MAFIYITGAPGVGKSTLQQALSKKGLEVHDIDDPALGGPHNKKTGKLVTIPPAADRNKGWFDEHEWRIYRAELEKLKSPTKDVIVCGVADSDQVVIDVFDKVIYLTIDNETLGKRLQSRSGNDYGKNDFELKEILQRKQRLDSLYQNAVAIKVDASKSLQETVNTILGLL